MFLSIFELVCKYSPLSNYTCPLSGKRTFLSKAAAIRTRLNALLEAGGRLHKWPTGDGCKPGQSCCRLSAPCCKQSLSSEVATRRKSPLRHSRPPSSRRSTEISAASRKSSTQSSARPTAAVFIREGTSKCCAVAPREAPKPF